MSTEGRARQAVELLDKLHLSAAPLFGITAEDGAKPSESERLEDELRLARIEGQMHARDQPHAKTRSERQIRGNGVGQKPHVLQRLGTVG